MLQGDDKVVTTMSELVVTSMLPGCSKVGISIWGVLYCISFEVCLPNEVPKSDRYLPAGIYQI